MLYQFNQGFPDVELILKYSDTMLSVFGGLCWLETKVLLFGPQCSLPLHLSFSILTLEINDLIVRDKRECK